MIRVLVADDHEIVRKGFAYIFAQTQDIELVGEAASDEELLERARSQRFDVAVLDILMPARGGLDLIKDLKRENPGCGIMIVSGYPEKQYAVRAYKAGAYAYLCKTRSSEEIVAAVRAVASGERYITQESAESLAKYIDNEQGNQAYNTLTTREMQIMLLIGAGMPPRLIAGKLSLSVKTIGTYRSRLMEKMGFSSNAEIIKYVIANHLVP